MIIESAQHSMDRMRASSRLASRPSSSVGTRPYSRASSSFSSTSDLSTRSASRASNASCSDNIRVIARFRPQGPDDSETPSVLQSLTDVQCQLATGDSNQTFTFDRVLGPEATQVDLFELCGLKPIVEDVLNGFNGSILAYGQTGSGKSYSMMGPDILSEQRGAIPRIMDHIFTVKEQEKSCDMQVTIAFFEVYKERIKDLIEPANANLQISDSPAGGIHVKNLSWHLVCDLAEVYALIDRGNRNRAVASTNCNKASSRSHSLFMVQVINTRGGEVRRGHLCLVDLAGSEKVSKTRATGETLEEAKSINRSLSALGMVINALTEGNRAHVPYRDSKLTRILQNSLGGNARTSLIVHCSSSEFHLNETLSTLRFGTRAKAVQNRPVADTINKPTHFELLKQELLKWRNGLSVPMSDRVELDADGSATFRPASALSQKSVRKSVCSYVESVVESVEEEESPVDCDSVTRQNSMLREQNTRLSRLIRTREMEIVQRQMQVAKMENTYRDLCGMIYDQKVDLELRLTRLRPRVAVLK